jgi:hypothetical protein
MRRPWGFTILHIAACLAVALPAAAGDYTPWPDRPASREAPQLVRAKKGGDSCCKHCTKGQPCGNSCISTKDRCHKPPGCAC